MLDLAAEFSLRKNLKQYPLVGLAKMAERHKVVHGAPLIAILEMEAEVHNALVKTMDHGGPKLVALTLSRNVARKVLVADASKTASKLDKTTNFYFSFFTALFSFSSGYLSYERILASILKEELLSWIISAT